MCLAVTLYRGSITSTVQELKQVCGRSNIYVLDNNVAVIGRVRFLGTTLWTDLLLFGEGEKRELAFREASGFMRDFSRIRMDEASGTFFAPADPALQFSRHANWLETKLAEPFRGQAVVITHHAPSPKSSPLETVQSCLFPD